MNSKKKLKTKYLETKKKTNKTETADKCQKKTYEKQKH